MSRIASIHVNPYAGLDGSNLTSNLVDLRDTFDWSLSFATVGASFSTHTLFLSNATGSARQGDAPADASFSAWTVLGTTALISGITLMEPPLGYAFARFVKTSGSTANINIRKLVR